MAWPDNRIAEEAVAEKEYKTERKLFFNTLNLVERTKIRRRLL